MVSWAADGKLSGYNSTTKKWSATAFTFNFASAAPVDLNGSTRLQYLLSADYPQTTHPNRLRATAPITLVSSDFTTGTVFSITASMFISAASWFPEGATPTASEILALGNSKVSVFRATAYATNAQTRTFEIPGPTANQFQPNTKYWVLVIPTIYVGGTTPSVTNDRPLQTAAPNVIGRVLSVWSNRTPRAPKITSPATGTVAPPGTTVNFAYTPDDPDKAVPSDPGRLNQDLAGVHVQFAPVATPENPNPVWADLPFYNSQNAFKSGWFIRGMADWYQFDGRDKMVDDLGFPILCGSNDTLPLHGALRGGDWQIRCRTFDFGHPYPLDENPLGNPNGTYTANGYPAANTSPWSESVRITVPSQVPPPTPLYPTDGLAVAEGRTVRLSWQYRNSARPAFAQEARTVQIRAVGDDSWSTIFAGPSSAHFVDLPPILDNPSHTPNLEYLTDLGFESGTLGGWYASNRLNAAGALTAPSNALNASLAHSGNRYLQYNYSGTGYPTLSRDITLQPQHDQFQFRGWIRPLDSVDWISLVTRWKDVNGVELPNPEGVGAWSLEKAPGTPWGGYVEVDTGLVDRLPGATQVELYFAGIGDTPSATPGKLDDVSFIGSSSSNADDFSIVATTEYEWRVKTRDTDNEESNYSASARFWIVPAPESGATRPEPSETIDGATLGCGKHRVEVYRRGGKVRVGELTSLSYVDWSRVRDDISTAKVVVSGWDVDCGNLLGQLESWAYEIVIFRDNGFSIDRVWEGPITLPAWEIDKVTIHAKDVMVYPYRRIIKQIMDDKGVGDTVVLRAARILQNVMAPDDPNVLAYLTVLSEPDDVKQYRSTPAYSRTAFEEIDDMAANQGLDYTAVGRSILLWGTKHRIGTLPEFKDENFNSPPIVSEYGMNMANVYAISDGNGVHGEATRLDVSGNDEKYGLVEMLSSSWASDSPEDSGTYTQAGLEKIAQSFKESAERSIADRYRPGAPLVVRIPDNTSLSPDTALSIQQLVPGVAIPLHSTATLREVRAIQKLDSVKVVEQGGVETISITLSQFDREDAEVPEGGEE